LSLVAGSVTVAPDESAAGTGMAKAIYDADVATIALPALPVLGSTAAPYSSAHPVDANDVNVFKAARLGLLTESARRATALAIAIVATLQADGIGT
jgi:hypothetical protein